MDRRLYAPWSHPKHDLHCYFGEFKPGFEYMGDVYYDKWKDKFKVNYSIHEVVITGSDEKFFNVVCSDDYWFTKEIDAINYVKKIYQDLLNNPDLLTA